MNGTALLFDRDSVETIDDWEAGLPQLRRSSVLWIDLERPEGAELEQLGEELELDAETVAALSDDGSRAPKLEDHETYVHVTAVGSGTEAVEQARADGFTVVGLELCDGATALHELELPDAVALVVGHEDHGVSKGALAACDRVAYLPQLGRVGSLNVATAAAIAIYELRRRAWT